MSLRHSQIHLLNNKLINFFQMNKLLILIKSPKLKSKGMQVLRGKNDSQQKCLVCGSKVKVDKSLYRLLREEMPLNRGKSVQLNMGKIYCIFKPFQL